MHAIAYVCYSAPPPPPQASGLGQRRLDEGGNDKELINYVLRYTPASIISDICRHTFFDKLAGKHTRAYVAACKDTGALKMHEEANGLGSTRIHTDRESAAIWLGCRAGPNREEAFLPFYSILLLQCSWG